MAVWDCDLTNSQCGLLVKGTAKRGGGVQGLTVRRCALPRVMVCQVGYNDDGGTGAPGPLVFRDFLFEELTLTGRYQDVDGDGSIKPCAPVELSVLMCRAMSCRNVTLRQLKLPGNEPQNIGCHCRAVSLGRSSAEGREGNNFGGERCTAYTGETGLYTDRHR